MSRTAIMRWFEFSHLPPELQEVAGPIHDLAVKYEENLPVSGETSAGLRKLLEAKDCFVRARLLEVEAQKLLQQ